MTQGGHAWVLEIPTGPRSYGTVLKRMNRIVSQGTDYLLPDKISAILLLGFLLGRIGWLVPL